MTELFTEAAEGGRKRHIDVAKVSLFDEFYTLDEDVDRVLNRHAEDLRGKRVFSNCDGVDSAFTRILTARAEELGLASFRAHPGPFGGQESLDILRRSDLVITNPPFSLKHSYLSTLYAAGVEFLLVWPSLGLKIKMVMPHIKDGLLHASGGWAPVQRFRVPPEYPKARRGEDGGYYGGVSCTWLTNLPPRGIHKKVNPSVRYDPQVHPKYDNLDIIDIPDINLIPVDYPGIMGAPMTYLGCPDHDRLRITDGLTTDLIGGAWIKGKKQFERILIRWRWAGRAGERERTHLPI